jgi:hypothetical protein
MNPPDDAGAVPCDVDDRHPERRRATNCKAAARKSTTAETMLCRMAGTAMQKTPDSVMAANVDAAMPRRSSPFSKDVISGHAAKGAPIVRQCREHRRVHPARELIQ